jgi:chaperonin cofactor prefoldin
MELARYQDSVGESLKMCRQPSIRERLDERKSALEADLKRVNDAIAALESAPETARVLELISKV